MRIGRRSSGIACPISKAAQKAKVFGGRRYLTDRHRQFRRVRQTNAETICYFLHIRIYVAGRRITPCGTSPVVRSRHNAMSSLRASATTMVLRPLPAATRAWYHCARALSF